MTHQTTMCDQPCDCGSTEAFWDDYPGLRREYACAECHDARKNHPKPTNTMRLRKVMLLKHQRNPQTGKLDPIDDKMALFHQWGFDTEDGQDHGIASYSTAICELPDGTIVNQYAQMIRFLDSPYPPRESTGVD